MLKNLKNLNNNHGDTIVEVMVVLAVLGLAIGISYATANRSLLDARQAQENAEATQLAESQVEQLRTLASSTAIYQTNPLFCLTNSSGTVQINSFPVVYNSPISAYPVNGQPDGYPVACSGNSRYHTSIQYINTSPPTDTFQVEVIWDNVFGQGQDTVRLVYRMHQPS